VNLLNVGRWLYPGGAAARRPRPRSDCAGSAGHAARHLVPWLAIDPGSLRARGIVTASHAYVRGAGFFRCACRWSICLIEALRAVPAVPPLLRRAGLGSRRGALR